MRHADLELIVNCRNHAREERPQTAEGLDVREAQRRFTETARALERRRDEAMARLVALAEHDEVVRDLLTVLGLR